MKLELVGVNKAFRQGQVELKILQSLDLNVAPGEIVAVVGESGSGKSTLLSLVAGFDSLDSGAMKWSGVDTLSWNESTWAKFRKSNLGFVFQSYHLIPYLTAEENVALPLKLKGQTDTQSAAQLLLQRLGLGSRLHHLPHQLSGGECQRVAIARALVHSPELILADEPTGSLDINTGSQVLDILFELLGESQRAALIVTHSLEVAARCHRVLTLKQGRLWPQ